MRKYIATGLVIALILSMTAQAKRAYIEPMHGNPFEEPCKIRCTCYCEHGVTGIGKKTRFGIVAGKKRVDRLHSRTKWSKRRWLHWGIYWVF